MWRIACDFLKEDSAGQLPMECCENFGRQSLVTLMLMEWRCNGIGHGEMYRTGIQVLDENT